MGRRMTPVSVGPYGARVRLVEQTFGGQGILVATHPSGYGQVQQSVGFTLRDADGKIDEKAKKAALAEAQKLSDLILAGKRPGAAAELTVGDVIRHFERDGLPALSPRRRKEVESPPLECLKNALGTIKVKAFSRSDWDRFIRRRMEGRIDAYGKSVPDGKRRPVGASTAGHDCGLLRQVMRWAEGQRLPNGEPLVERDVTRGFALPKNENPRRVWADDDVTERIVEVAADVHEMLRPIVVLAAETGRRRGAILALRWSDWMPDEGTYGMIRWRADSDKLGKEWVTPCTPTVRVELEAWRKACPGVGEAWLFPAPDSDGHLRGDVALSWLQKAECKARGDGETDGEHVKGFGFHSFRRRWATKRKDLSLRDVAHVGGWKSVVTLQTVYQTPDLETMEEVVCGGRPLQVANRS